MLGELETVKWLLNSYGPAIIPSLIALFLAFRVAKERTSSLFEDYHTAILDNTRVMQHLATLLDERTRKQDERSSGQDERDLRQDARSKSQDERGKAQSVRGQAQDNRDDDAREDHTS